MMMMMMMMMMMLMMMMLMLMLMLMTLTKFAAMKAAALEGTVKMQTMKTVVRKTMRVF